MSLAGKHWRETVLISSGKTVNARRSLPQTERTREVFKLCNDLFPDSEWCFPGLKGGHYSEGALDSVHLRVRSRRSLTPAVSLNAGINVEASSKTVVVQGMPAFLAEFVLHSLRHTFATRAAESGMHPATLAKLMGHSSTRITDKYLHISSDHATLEMKRAEEYGRILRGERGEVQMDTSAEKSRTS